MDAPHQGPLNELKGSRIRFHGVRRAVVRFRSDPANAGRVKVQVVGIHKEGEDVAMLPWARPNATAWQEGGDFCIPPVNSVVNVMFEDGDHEYPVYFGGWWVLEEPRGTTPKGRGISKHVRWPTSAFGSYGGAKYVGGLLRLEDRADAKNAPDNFIKSSPLGKRLELDDRAGRNRLVLADQVDNGLFINSERGALSLESYCGLRSMKNPSLKGLLMSSEKDNGYFQVYSARGWRITESDQGRFMEMVSPSGCIVRLDDSTQTTEAWTPGGRRIAMSDSIRRMEMRSPDGRGVVVDDGAGAVLLSSNTTGMYVAMSDADELLEFRSTGNLVMKADGNILLMARGNIITQGKATFIQPGIPVDLNPVISTDFASAKIKYRDGAPFLKRPYEHEEQREA